MEIEYPDNLNNLLVFFFQLKNDVKLFHWSTKSYGRHKSSDELVSKLDDNIDTFVEVLLGRLKVRPNIEKRILIRTIDDNRIITILNDAVKVLDEDIPKYIQYTELLNIRDEMLQNINQTLYLLTFN
jgi:hypothetical protein